jgi:hypothetical protein
MDPISQPTFALGSGYEHVKHDLTPHYRNAYSGIGDNPSVRVAATDGVVRKLIHFQATLGSLNPLVIFDKVVSTNASYKKSWVMHMVGAPTVDASASNPGDTTYTGASVTKSDNGTGRLYVSHLLPAAPKVRTVGGNACATKSITGATNANPAVYTIPGHGMVAGEAFRMETGLQYSTGGYSAKWPNWQIDTYFASHTVDTVIDADHITISSGYGRDSTGYQPWTTAFLSGNGAPTGTGAFTGQVYYQQDATAGKTVWVWDAAAPGAWKNAVTDYGVDAYGFTSPVVAKHASCVWTFYVDQLGPSGSGGAHLWNATQNNEDTSVHPHWRIEVQPASDATTDYFLNVVNPTDTTVGTAPATSQVSGSGIYGAVIADSGGSYVAVFSPTVTDTLTYTATHSGAGKHVVSGLAPGTYAVTQGGSPLAGTHTADASGAIEFTESGGGVFAINVGEPAAPTPRTYRGTFRGRRQ